MKMNVSLLKSKIHKARITECEIDYEGSLEINSDYMGKVGLLPYEKILVVNSTNGERLETYAIPGPVGEPEFKLNGAAARKGAIGDTIIVMSFAQFKEDEAENWKPKIIVLDEHNQIIAQKGSLKR